MRKEATGYGLAFFVREMLQVRSETFDGQICVVSGAGNVAIYTIEKVHQLGGRVVACSDSSGLICDEEGVDVELHKQVKEVERTRGESVTSEESACLLPQPQPPERSSQARQA